MSGKTKKKTSIESMVKALIIWLLSIPGNMIPLYLKYLLEKDAKMIMYSLFEYVMRDRECTFVFVVLGTMLLLEGECFHYNGSKFANFIFWVLRILTIVFVVTLLLVYVPNVISIEVWCNHETKMKDLNSCFLIISIVLGVFSHIFIYRQKKEKI